MSLFAQSGQTPAGHPAKSQDSTMASLPVSMSSDINRATPEKVALGRMLYYDARLSQDNTVSCNSCHDLEKYGVDGLQFSTGIGGQKGGRNAPTVYNAAGQTIQFWDGRATDVERQAKGPVLNPVEMGMSSAARLEIKLRSIPGYAAAFTKAFPGQDQPVTFDNVALAIGAFERGLVTPSRWDKFVAGDQQALSSAEFTGHHDFTSVGCSNCHESAYVGGNSLQKLGEAKPWPVETDTGREAVTKYEGDHMMFKVPTLRNIARTAPYFHDGSIVKLDDAVRRMAEYQLGVSISDAQVTRIVAWLNALTGEIPSDYIRKPALPQ
jgi:cytochrome c peroxidase